MKQPKNNHKASYNVVLGHKSINNKVHFVQALRASGNGLPIRQMEMMDCVGLTRPDTARK